jgi:Phosphoenolpyruvate synthase/pyruvate phosphate dikinase
LVGRLDPDDVGALEDEGRGGARAVESLAIPAEIDRDPRGLRAARGRARARPARRRVRSSAVAEDAADASFAGMQSTYLFLRGPDETLDAVRRCWASYFNAEASPTAHGTAAPQV